MHLFPLLALKSGAFRSITGISSKAEVGVAEAWPLRDAYS